MTSIELRRQRDRSRWLGIVLSLSNIEPIFGEVATSSRLLKNTFQRLKSGVGKNSGERMEGSLVQYEALNSQWGLGWGGSAVAVQLGDPWSSCHCCRRAHPHQDVTPPHRRQYAGRRGANARGGNDCQGMGVMKCTHLVRTDGAEPGYASKRLLGAAIPVTPYMDSLL